MKKRVWALLTALALVLSSCTVQGRPAEDGAAEQTYPDGTLTYTNLVGEAVQEEVKAACRLAGVEEGRMEQLFVWIDDFNGCMDGCEAYELQDAFTRIDAPAVDYGDYYPRSVLWFRTNRRDYGDVLCRIAAFQLMGDRIGVAEPIDKEKWACYTDAQWLYSDWDAINGNPLIQFDEEEIAHYFTLYQPVGIPAGCSEGEMEQAVADGWRRRGISFLEGDISLVTIWTQYGEQAAVAHAAVLLDMGERLLLVEKTDPQSPYQAAWFSDPAQVARYLYESVRLDSARYGQEVGPYIVMRNDQRLEV